MRIHLGIIPKLVKKITSFAQGLYEKEQAAMSMTNPTGGKMRTDPMGKGGFLAPRGGRDHKGLDFTLPDGVGQDVVSPLKGLVRRLVKPYAGLDFDGLVITDGIMRVCLYYVAPDASLLGKEVREGQVIGVAQDITLRKSLDGRTWAEQGMVPHVHMECTVNPAFFVDFKQKDDES